MADVFLGLYESLSFCLPAFDNLSNFLQPRNPGEYVKKGVLPTSQKFGKFADLTLLKARIYLGDLKLRLRALVLKSVRA